MTTAPRAPVARGAVAAGLLAALSLTLTLAFGWSEHALSEAAFWRDPRGWFDTVMAALFGWAIGGSTALRQGALRDQAELRGALEPSIPPPALEPFPRRARTPTAVAAVVLGGAINLSPGNWPGTFPGVGDPFVLWSTLRTIAITAALLHTGVVATRIAAYFSALGATLRVDDLLDLRALAPLGRGGLRNVAVWVGITVLFATMMIAPFGRSVAASNLVVSAAVGLAVFLAPVRGAHLRLAEARDTELLRVRHVLRRRTSPANATPDADTDADAHLAALPLADLLAWESRIERVRTWPFDGSTLLRFGFYVALGLGSWVGAALVERMLGAALS